MKQVLRVHAKGVRPYKRGAFRDLLGHIAAISTRLELPPEVKKRAGTICSDAITLRFGHDIPHSVLAAASLYVSCRESKVPVTLRELAGANGSEIREVGRCYVSLLEGMHISRPDLNGRGYVLHLALKKPFSDDALQAAQETARVATLNGLGGWNPMTLAAASLYLACRSRGENVTQAELAEAAGVGEESVRECGRAIRLLSKHLGLGPLRATN